MNGETHNRDAQDSAAYKTGNVYVKDCGSKSSFFAHILYLYLRHAVDGIISVQFVGFIGFFGAKLNRDAIAADGLLGVVTRAHHMTLFEMVPTDLRRERCRMQYGIHEILT